MGNTLGSKIQQDNGQRAQTGCNPPFERNRIRKEHRTEQGYQHDLEAKDRRGYGYIAFYREKCGNLTNKKKEPG